MKATIDKVLLEQALEAHHAMREWIKAAPEPTIPMPGTDGDWLDDVEASLEAALAEPAVEPVAWMTFDGEGGYDLRLYDMNESYRNDYIKRNGEKYASWVQPLYASPPPPPAELEALRASHGQAPAGAALEPIAYLDIGTGGYLDLGTDLADEALSRLPKGRHALVIAGTYGIDGYIAAPTTQPEPQQELRCNPHPKAPHGFDRNASHSAHRYVCECESWEPYDAGFNAGFQAGMKAEQALYESAEATQEMEKRNDQA